MNKYSVVVDGAVLADEKNPVCAKGALLLVRSKLYVGAQTTLELLNRMDDGLEEGPFLLSYGFATAQISRVEPAYPLSKTAEKTSSFRAGMKGGKNTRFKESC